jgi:signal-transduction protein with cAMP-binding, CBS, and nucleotidyltransferase domain
LQEIPYFEDVEPRSLKNIAANLQIKNYSLGEFICKSGEIPEGLFIILKG